MLTLLVTSQGNSVAFDGLPLPTTTVCLALFLSKSTCILTQLTGTGMNCSQYNRLLD